MSVQKAGEVRATPGWMLKSLLRAVAPPTHPHHGDSGRERIPLEIFLDRPIWLCEEEDRKQGDGLRRVCRRWAVNDQGRALGQGRENREEGT